MSSNVRNFPPRREFLRRLMALSGAAAASHALPALAAIPDQVVDDLILHGSPAEVRAKIDRYAANGVTTPALSILPYGLDLRTAIRDVAPRR